MVKRGQAALEFLTTYGWAFLVILVVIGALAYFGVLNPSKFVPERCTTGQELTCKDYIAQRNSDTDTDVMFWLQNNLGDSIIITDVAISSPTVDGVGDCITDTAFNLSLGPSEASDVNCTFTQQFPNAGNKATFEFEVTYRELGGKYDHVVNGEIYATLQS